MTRAFYTNNIPVSTVMSYWISANVSSIPMCSRLVSKSATTIITRHMWQVSIPTSSITVILCTIHLSQKLYKYFNGCSPTSQGSNRRKLTRKPTGLRAKVMVMAATAAVGLLLSTSQNDVWIPILLHGLDHILSCFEIALCVIWYSIMSLQMKKKVVLQTGCQDVSRLQTIKHLMLNSAATTTTTSICLRYVARDYCYLKILFTYNLLFYSRTITPSTSS